MWTSGVETRRCVRGWERRWERRCEGKREIAIYRVLSFKQIAKNDVKYLKVRRKKMSLYAGILHEDGQTGVIV
jgi:hypothetical protein